MRPDQLHVAQQIRRDKLRIQNQEFPNSNIEQLLSLHQTTQQPASFNNLDLLHLRNANNNMLDDHDHDQGLYSSSQMINSFSTPSNPLQRNPLEYCHELGEQSSHNNRVNYYYENHETNPNSFMHTSELHNNDIFKSSRSISSHSTSEMASLMNHHGIWGGGNSNNPIVPVFHENQANMWTNRGVTVENNNMNSFFADYNPQGLSLSLSSNSQSKPSTSSSNFDQGSLNVVKPIHQELHSNSTTSSSSGFRNVGPLGPFTGYATILKNSRYLKPCQELLEECCCFIKSFDNNNNVPRWVSRDVVGCSSSGGGVDENGVSAKGSSNSGGSSSMLHGSKEKENSVDDGGIGNNFCLSSSSSSRPECQKNKAQLLYMHDEVCFLHCSCNPYSLFYFMYDFIYFLKFFLYVIVT